MIALGDDYAVVYSCGDRLFSTEYAVRILSRNPTLSEERKDELVGMANDMGLNPYELPYDTVIHDDCW